MAKKKLKWTDSEDIAFQLIDKYPSVNPTKLSLSEIGKRASTLPNMAGTGKPSEDALEAIQQVWFEERSDMEDELGPLGEDVSDDEDLDEDEYRNDRMIDDEASLSGLDDDEEEDELGDGFHEDEIEDER